MKKVIKPATRTDIVSLEKVSHSKIYGLSVEGKPEAVISRRDYLKGNYKIMAFSGITNGNHYNSQERDTLQATISALLESESYEVFEFDNWNEFAKWSLTGGNN